MQTKFSHLDYLKISWLIEETAEKLNFLALIKPDPIGSSESAKNEITKALSTQAHLETKYSELSKVRNTLKGISNKQKLEEVQTEIQSVVLSLKETATRLGSLFRENPSYDKDTAKVNSEKAVLLGHMESILSTPHGFSLVELQAMLIKELEGEESLKQNKVLEQTLIQEIKELDMLQKKEKEELEEIASRIEAFGKSQKEKLSQENMNSELQKKLLEKELEAKEQKLSRLNDQKVQQTGTGIQELEKKKAIEALADEKIKNHLKRKEEQRKKEVQEWTEKSEEARKVLDLKVQDLNNEKAKALSRLQKVKEEFEQADSRRKERERKALEKEEAKQRKLLEEEKVNEAVKTIQQQFLSWKETKNTVKNPPKTNKAPGKAGQAPGKGTGQRTTNR